MYGQTGFGADSRHRVCGRPPDVHGGKTWTEYASCVVEILGVSASLRQRGRIVRGDLGQLLERRPVEDDAAAVSERGRPFSGSPLFFFLGFT